MPLNPTFARNITLGTILSFRYTSPGATDPAPTILVITPNWENKMHGLNLRYMRPAEVEQLQWVFKTPEQQKLVMNPFSQEYYSEAQKKAKQQAEQRRQQYMQQQQGVIVKPAEQSSFGVSTFGPTRKEMMQAHPGMAGVEPPPEEEFAKQQWNEQKRKHQQYLQELSKKIAQNKALISNPYNFYHQYVKNILGPNTYNVAKVYRKYSWQYIVQPRIIRNLAYGIQIKDYGTQKR